MIDIGEPATIDEELDVRERLDGMTTRYLKQLLTMRDVNLSRRGFFRVNAANRRPAESGLIDEGV